MPLNYRVIDYRLWDSKMARQAKVKAKDWFDSFVNEGFDHVCYDTAFCKIDEIYLLTKVQTILMYSGIILEHEIKPNTKPNQDVYPHSVEVFMYNKDEYEARDSSSESESDDDPL